MIDPDRSSSPLDDVDGLAELWARSKPIAVARLQVLRAATAAAPTDDEAATAAPKAGRPAPAAPGPTEFVIQSRRDVANVEAHVLRALEGRPRRPV